MTTKLRIISGQFRNRIIKSPPDNKSRPTLSRIRESLFNIIAPNIAGSIFLDLYAGTGSIGLEALSRGSEKVFFVETDQKIGQLLQANLLQFDPDKSATELMRMPAFSAIKMLEQRREKFDIVFMDPPYQQKEIDDWAHSNELHNLLKPAGQLILQHGVKQKVPDNWAGCQKQQSRKYGQTILSFFGVG